MRKIIFFSLLFYSCNFLFAQQFPSSVHINFNQFFFNPGYIGSSESSNLILSHKSKWQDIEGAPKTRFFGAHTPFKKGISFGVSFLNDVIGPSSTNSFFASSSYTVSLNNNSKLSVGLRLGFSQYTGNLSSININDPMDPVFTTDILNEYIPNMGFGLYYNYYDNYFIGFSIPSFVQNDYYQGKEQRSYFFTAGKSFKFFPDHVIRTAFVLSGTEGVPLKWDLNVCYFSAFDLGLGFNYSHNESIAPIVYAEISEILSLGYAYSISMADIVQIADNTHELILRVNFIK